MTYGEMRTARIAELESLLEWLDEHVRPYEEQVVPVREEIERRVAALRSYVADPDKVSDGERSILSDEERR
jgi:hypothetical protein